MGVFEANLWLRSFGFDLCHIFFKKIKHPADPRDTETLRKRVYLWLRKKNPSLNYDAVTTGILHKNCTCRYCIYVFNCNQWYILSGCYQSFLRLFCIYRVNPCISQPFMTSAQKITLDLKMGQAQKADQNYHSINIIIIN